MFLSDYYRLGVDVGGTHTDAVILNQHLHCVAKIKVPTSDDVYLGITQAIGGVLQLADIAPSQIQYAMLGTTQCTNALVERRNLDRVGYLRLSLPSGDSIPPLFDWAQEWQQLLGEHFYQVHGGYEFDGRELHPLCEHEIRQVCAKMRGQVESVAICGVFSPVNGAQEIAAAQWVEEMLPGIPLSLSHRIGGIGLLERENAIILNAALQSTAQRFTESFRQALHQHQIEAIPYFSQNDGTLISEERVKQYPILTLACGPTNSIRGACHLSGYSDALVIDVGGTTTDIGILNNGFPRESSTAAELGQVRTNLRMPDIISLGIGGGTRVHQNINGALQLGPDSVGYHLLERGLSFGGDTLTLTDVLLHTTGYRWPDPTQLQMSSPDRRLCQQAYRLMIEQIEEAIDKMKTSSAPIPAILVGGGSILLPDHLAGISQIIRPEHFDAANAIGVALGQVSGQVDRIVKFAEQDRKTVKEKLQQEAVAQAVAAGAIAHSIEIIEYLEVPLAYLPGHAVRVKVRAAGRLA